MIYEIALSSFIGGLVTLFLVDYAIPRQTFWMLFRSNPRKYVRKRSKITLNNILFRSLLLTTFVAGIFLGRTENHLYVIASSSVAFCYGCVRCYYYVADRKVA